MTAPAIFAGLADGTLRAEVFPNNAHVRMSGETSRGLQADVAEAAIQTSANWPYEANIFTVANPIDEGYGVVAPNYKAGVTLEEAIAILKTPNAKWTGPAGANPVG